MNKTKKPIAFELLAFPFVVLDHSSMVQVSATSSNFLPFDV